MGHPTLRTGGPDRPVRRLIIFYQSIGVFWDPQRAGVIYYLHYTLITIITNIIICMAASGTPLLIAYRILFAALCTFGLILSIFGPHVIYELTTFATASRYFSNNKYSLFGFASLAICRTFLGPQEKGMPTLSEIVALLISKKLLNTGNSSLY